MFPLNLYARVRFLHTFAHETAGAARTRCSLRPHFFGVQLELQTSGALSREIAKSYFQLRSPETAIPLRKSGICHLDQAAAMG